MLNLFPQQRFLILANLLLLVLSSVAAGQQKPNIILIFTDDQGYGDIGCFGGKGFQTPHLDRMADEGVRFTSFYVGSPVCSGSRAALMTGCDHTRVGVPGVIFPSQHIGLDPSEITIAEILKTRGYRTACIGKWHLGHHHEYLPTRQGFDEYFGIPHSNNLPAFPGLKPAKGIIYREGMTAEILANGPYAKNKPPLMRGEEVIEYPPEQHYLTRTFTEAAIRFMKQNKDGPFFMYLPHAMAHSPLHRSPEFAGRTETLLGDVLEEIDWSVGEIIKTVKELGIDETTLIIFTTDNGPAKGSSGPLRGKKFSIFEGGVRVPCIMRWPGQLPAGEVCSEIAATIDFLPTFAHLAGGQVPNDRVIDGKNIWPLMKEPKSKSPHEFYCLNIGNGSVRSGKWKYYPPSKKVKKSDIARPRNQWTNTRLSNPAGALYDLSTDLGETNDVFEERPEVVAQMQAAFEAHLTSLKDHSRRPK